MSEIHPLRRGLRRADKVIPARVWTEEEVVQVRAIMTDYSQNAMAALALRLGRTQSSVEKVCLRVRNEAGIVRRRRPLTDDEKKLVLDTHVEGANDWAHIVTLIPDKSERQLYDWWQRQRGRSVEIRAQDQEDYQIYGESGMAKTEPCLQSCLCCRQSFMAWDKKKNRLCSTCGSVHDDGTDESYSAGYTHERVLQPSFV